MDVGVVETGAVARVVRFWVGLIFFGLPLALVAWAVIFALLILAFP